MDVFFEIAFEFIQNNYIFVICYLGIFCTILTIFDKYKDPDIFLYLGVFGTLAMVYFYKIELSISYSKMTQNIAIIMTFASILTLLSYMNDDKKSVMRKKTVVLRANIDNEDKNFIERCRQIVSNLDKNKL